MPDLKPIGSVKVLKLTRQQKLETLRNYYGQIFKKFCSQNFLKIWQHLFSHRNCVTTAIILDEPRGTLTVNMNQ